MSLSPILNISVFIPCAATLYLTAFVIYYRFLHPLAKYPGPFLASFTDLWQVYQFMTLQQPYNLTKLHEKYGPIVRYGPDKLSITHESAVKLIYQAPSRLMPKTEFYDAYGAAHPNVFGMRDEALHSVRRRHMSHSFSISYVKEMEQYMDMNIKILKEKLRSYAATNEAFDLKKALHLYVVDTLGELAFSQSFNVQRADDESRAPPVKEHSLLAAVTGAWPAMTKRLKRWLPYVPHKDLRRLFEGRNACAKLASECVKARLSTLRKNEKGDFIAAAERKDILASLILAKDPETGASLTQIDLETEAFGFIIAGTHTTGATTALLFYHLLHNPETMAKCVAEINDNLPSLEPDQDAYPVTLVEASLPYLRDCMKENFRITPVFTMPLARRIMAPNGLVIGDNHIPVGTSVAICNHAFHHNPSIWGPDHNIFDPSRWTTDASTAATKSRLLMHFGMGGRQCIGKTVAMTNIYKLMSSLLRDFEFELASEEEKSNAANGLYRGKIPEMVSVGISELKAPLMVRVRVKV